MRDTGMNRHVNAISRRLSLRPPQQILQRISEIVPPGKEADTTTLLASIPNARSDLSGEFPPFSLNNMSARKSSGVPGAQAEGRVGKPGKRQSHRTLFIG